MIWPPRGSKADLWLALLIANAHIRALQRAYDELEAKHKNLGREILDL